MNTRSVFHLIHDLTQEEGVSCVLIGGFAVNYYKFSRQTADIDFLITKEDFEKISGLLKEAGYKQENRENFIQMESSQLSLMDVDFMLVDRETLNKILKESREIIIAGQKLIVPSLNHLIALKLHSIKSNYKLRFVKDFPDIVSLIRINGIDARSNDFKRLCLQHGTEELYQKILEVM